LQDANAAVPGVSFSRTFVGKLGDAVHGTPWANTSLIVEKQTQVQ
jgi:hypothetical protein